MQEVESNEKLFQCENTKFFHAVNYYQQAPLYYVVTNANRAAFQRKPEAIHECNFTFNTTMFVKDAGKIIVRCGGLNAVKHLIVV